MEKMVSIYDPLYGELLTVNEVVSATGFTVNQLRNWRNEERFHLAPFGYVAVGAKPYYRAVVIEAYVAKNGGSQSVYKPSGMDVEFPVDEVLEQDETKRKALIELASITTANQWLKWTPFFGRVAPKTWADDVNRLQPELFAKWAKTSQEVANYVPYGKRGEFPEQWFVGNVLAFRRMLCDLRGWDISDDELFALPVGDVPPLKETDK
jgi:hypothetical protein